MPSDAAAKLAATRGYGAEVVLYDRTRENRAEIAGGIARERHATLVPPFDDPAIIAGQGTAVLELIEDAGSSTSCSYRSAVAGYSPAARWPLQSSRRAC